MRAQANLILSDLVFGAAILFLTILGMTIFGALSGIDADADKHRVNIESSYTTRILLNTELDGVKLSERIRLGEDEEILLQRIANTVRPLMEVDEAVYVDIGTPHFITREHVISQEDQQRDVDVSTRRYSNAPRITVPLKDEEKDVLIQFISSDELLDIQDLGVGDDPGTGTTPGAIIYQ